MLANLLEQFEDRLTADDVPTLAGTVEGIFTRIQAAEAAMVDPEEYKVSAYLTDPAKQRIAQRAVSGRTIAVKLDNARLLHSVAVELDSFYEAELKPL